MAVVTELVEAVKDLLNSGSFSQSFTAKRIYLLPEEIEQMTGLTVLVLSNAEEIEGATRGSDKYTVPVQIAIAKKIDSKRLVSEMDSMLEFTQEIKDLLRSTKKPPNYTDARISKITNAPLYDPEQLELHSCFVTAMVIEYELAR